MEFSLKLAARYEILNLFRFVVWRLDKEAVNDLEEQAVLSCLRPLCVLPHELVMPVGIALGRHTFRQTLRLPSNVYCCAAMILPSNSNL